MTIRVALTNRFAPSRRLESLKQQVARFTSTCLGAWCAVSLLSAILSPCASAASSQMSTVGFYGVSSDPEVRITGEGFGRIPETGRPAFEGYTGDDYGTALHICDTTDNPSAFCAGEGKGTGDGDTIGLVITSYSDSQVAFNLGSIYPGYYFPATIFRLQQGDHFTVDVAGLICSGIVDYNGGPVLCNGSPTEAQPPEALRRSAEEPPTSSFPTTESIGPGKTSSETAHTPRGRRPARCMASLRKKVHPRAMQSRSRRSAETSARAAHPSTPARRCQARRAPGRTRSGAHHH